MQRGSACPIPLAAIGTFSRRRLWPFYALEWPNQGEFLALHGYTGLLPKQYRVALFPVASGDQKNDKAICNADQAFLAAID